MTEQAGSPNRPRAAELVVTGQRGPDLVLAGAARSGTTLLAGRLGRHPGIVSPSIKEPNFFGSRLDRGFEWYASLYPTTDGLWLDASAQYTFPTYPDAMARAAQASPQLRVVYLVRDPIPRAFSHYCHEVLYLGKHGGASFGSALHLSADFAGASDYATVLAQLQQVVPADRLLVLPFEHLVDDLVDAAELTWRFAGLDPAAAEFAPTTESDELFTNERAVIGNPVVRGAFNSLRGTRFYPRLRALVGAERMRAARARLTSNESIPSLQEALRTCTPADLELLDELRDRSAAAVRDLLAVQDDRLGTTLLSACRWAEAP